MPNLLIENLDPVLVGVNPENASMPALIGTVHSACIQIAPDRSTVNIVLSGDFIESVNDRLKDAGLSHAFDTTRGSGFAAAKTLPRKDGTIDVVFNAALFAVELPENQQDEFKLLALHTAVHEFQHVAMRQRHESVDWHGYSSYKQQNLISAADAIIDEFRADKGANQLVSYNPGWDLAAIASDLTIALHDIVMSYQHHLDVGKLVYEVGKRCLISWKELAFTAAAMLEIPGSVDIPSGEAEEWRFSCEHSWPTFLAILRKLPPGCEPIDPSALKDAGNEMAALLDTWLRAMGFDWDEPYFSIEKYLNAQF